jgi:hypothetical protein
MMTARSTTHRFWLGAVLLWLGGGCGAATSDLDPPTAAAADKGSPKPHVLVGKSFIHGEPHGAINFLPPSGDGRVRFTKVTWEGPGQEDYLDMGTAELDSRASFIVLTRTIRIHRSYTGDGMGGTRTNEGRVDNTVETVTYRYELTDGDTVLRLWRQLPVAPDDRVFEGGRRVDVSVKEAPPEAFTLTKPIPAPRR